MITGLTSSLSALQTLSSKQNVIANNLANLNTPGFKAQRANLQETPPSGPPTAAPPGALPVAPPGDGVKLASTSRISGPGATMQTGNPLDLAIRGEGYLTVQLQNGTQALTRAGNLHVSSEGTVVTEGGKRVMGFPLVPPGTRSISISSAGVGTYESPAGDVKFQIPLARVSDPGGLENLGENLLKPTAASGAPIQGNPESEGLGSISQGAIELSNVDMVQEMVNMIEVKHAYSASIKTIKTADKMAGESIDLLKK